MMDMISVVVSLLVLVVWLVPTVKILHKAGYSGWWCILSLIPLVNIIFLWVFAFADWPALRAAQTRP
jgi:uncharacterized membrane protein YhaH (DUF805 family)